MNTENPKEHTFIKELLGEMKNQFNKSENLKQADIGHKELGENDSDLKGVSESIINESTSIDLDLANQSLIGMKTPSPTKRTIRNKSTSSEEPCPKRSSSRRLKNLKGSVLQSAIARKEQSYNEPSKPRRLSRTLKPTQKILENLAFVKHEKRIKILPKCVDKPILYNISTSNITRKNKSKKDIDKLKNDQSELCGEELDTEESRTSDSEENLDVVKTKRKSQRVSAGFNKGDSDEPTNSSPSVADQVNDSPDDPECSSVEALLITSELCLCTQKSNLYQAPNQNDIVHCSAIDSISEKLLGCSREVNIEETSLSRPSQRVPYLILCDSHRNRLFRHNCCPTCGVFCTQGQFVECSAKHQFHRSCQIMVGNTGCCPHCGISTPSHDIFISMHCSNKPVFLPAQSPKRLSAKMIFPHDKENSSRSTPLLLPIETFQVFNTPHLHGQIFDENDLVNALKEQDIVKLASIIASDSIDMHFRLTEFNNGSLLHYAAHTGLPKICHLLVSAGLEINDFDKEQNTPLMLATAANKNDVVQYLVRSGASITVKGTDGMTPLHIAAKTGNISACRILLEAGTTIKNYVNCQDDGGWTPLVWACENGYADVGDFLIMKGADPLLRDVEHNEALHWAAFSGSSHIVELLLNRGCDVNTVNGHGETPLHIAAREDRYNCIITLLARGANVFLMNKNNERPHDCVPEDGVSVDVIALNVQLQSVTGLNSRKYKFILSEDISKGRETNPIQCVNTLDDEPEPKDFTYILKSRLSSEGFSIDTRLSILQTCNCDERCTSDICDCGKLSRKCWYEEEGKLTLDFDYSDSPMIFECNDACSCNAITCKNRVVQRGLQQRFQIYKTESRGWGVKTLKSIVKGSFVCEYVGEILNDAEADQREDDTFLFDLDNRDSETFCVDAKYYGNFARFINHSCSPNLHPVKVFVDHHDLRFPKVAFFASKDITPDEEISFDYGHKFWLVKYKSFTCHCDSPDCKYSEETIRQTLMHLEGVEEEIL
ncbi:unnamed protein product [Phaedon cochleariae]|uniref:Uncharacterized protein n=1 Tax=Phaedon cochleariae TaxID=80249 RepID=A0A9P0DSF5_PHACE|nr:unnamed protein product [Phaedon cochleariae]